MATRSKEKSQARAKNKDMRPFAQAKYIRMSPYKVRQVMALVRGKPYYNAVAILENLPKAASTPILKVMNSAAANAEHNLNLSKKDLFVCEIFADQGPTMKRVMPRARGSADRVLKRMSHITVILDVVKDEPVKEAK